MYKNAMKHRLQLLCTILIRVVIFFLSFLAETNEIGKSFCNALCEYLHIVTGSRFSFDNFERIQQAKVSTIIIAISSVFMVIRFRVVAKNSRTQQLIIIIIYYIHVLYSSISSFILSFLFLFCVSICFLHSPYCLTLRDQYRDQYSFQYLDSHNNTNKCMDNDQTGWIYTLNCACVFKYRYKMCLPIKKWKAENSYGSHYWIDVFLHAWTCSHSLFHVLISTQSQKKYQMKESYYNA